MGWSVPEYYNTYMGGDPSHARIAMFELMRAVNERETSARLPLTQFVRSDETEGANLTVEEVAWIPAATKDNSPAQQNLKRIRDAILVMAPPLQAVQANKFILPESYGVDLTRPWLENEIGFDLSDDILHPQSAAYWQALQDALDLLTHIRLDRGGLNYYGYDPPITRELIVADGPGAQATWDAMLADTPAVTTLFVPITLQLSITKSASPSFDYYTMGSIKDYKNLHLIDPPTGFYDGLESSYLGAGLVYSANKSAHVALDEIDVLLDGTLYTIEIGTTGILLLSTSQVPLDDKRSDISFGLANLPAETPFLGPEPTVESVAVTSSSIHCYFDLTSLLSDQA